MISLCEKIPFFDDLNAELLKINLLYDAYKNDNKVLFWVQNEKDALISMTDGNMIIYNHDADVTELKEFVCVMNPVCIYSDYETLLKIDRKPDEKINIMSRKANINGTTQSDILSSKEIYDLLDVKGLSLPEYPFFAVDYCRRLNMGTAKYFALKNKCAIITFNHHDKAIINGIASREKGFGSIALNAALQQNLSKTVFVCCRDSVKGFYIKNGFLPCYYGGYWVRK